jgi:hypothetical protein
MPKGQLETLEPSTPTSEPKSTGALPRRVLASGSQQASPQQEKPSVRKLPTVERSERPPIRRATGPRTSRGKERSKLNALKHGLLSKAILLKGESRAEYTSLHDGLRQSLDPQGRLEDELVENLAVLLWRKRRLLQAERAEISKADVLRDDATIKQFVQRLNYALPEGPLVGELGSGSNLSVLHEAIICIEKYRMLLSAKTDEELERIRRVLCGQPVEGPARERAAREGMEIARLMTPSASAVENAADPEQSDQLRNAMLKALDAELSNLLDVQRLQTLTEFNKIARNFEAACIPSQEAVDRLLRYETHLSREFDRTLSQLERLQRMRLGQPVLPPIDVRLSGYK